MRLAALVLSAFIATACDRSPQPEDRGPASTPDPAQRRVEEELGVARATVRAAEAAREPYKLPAARPVGHLEVVALFNAAMPTGVTVSHTGRVFVNFPRWGDPVDVTVAEVKNGRVDPY